MWDRPEHEHQHEHERAESELASVIDELRAEVPVRPEWHARLQRELLAAAPSFGAGSPRHAGTGGAPLRWQFRPLTAVAAAVVFTVLGASGALLASGRVGDTTDTRGADIVPVAPAGAATAPTVASAGDVGVRFAVMAPGVKHVSLVGDFNGWDPKATPLLLSRDGRTWSIMLPLGSGRHTYAFVIDDEIVADPAAPTAVDDDFGTPSSIVLVGNSLP